MTASPPARRHNGASRIERCIHCELIDAASSTRDEGNVADGCALGSLDGHLGAGRTYVAAAHYPESCTVEQFDRTSRVEQRRRLGPEALGPVCRVVLVIRRERSDARLFESLQLERECRGSAQQSTDALSEVAIEVVRRSKIVGTHSQQATRSAVQAS